MLYYYSAEVVRVYDGDTIFLNIDLGMSTFVKSEKIRLAHINTPELRGEEREDGIKSRDF
jgi:micrococcal nuclease